MNIAMVCYASHGGSGTLATELGIRLAARGHKIHFVSADVPYRLLESSWKKNVFFHEVQTFDYPLFVTSPYDLSLVNKIYEVASQNKIDIIHSHYAIPHSPVAFLAKSMLKRNNLDVKTVTTLHGTDVYLLHEDTMIRDVVEFSLKESDGVTTVSKSLAGDAKEVFRLEKLPKVIYNFVTISSLKKDSNGDLRGIFGPNSEKILTHMSNFREVKRIQDVIQIFGLVDKKVPSRLILIGDGPEKNTAYKYAKKLNLLTKIHFLGLQSNIGKLMSISDLFLLPSEKESFGLSALEAMACGVPVVATNACGIPEVVENGVTGYLSDVGDIKKMSEDAIKLLTNAEIYKEFSKSGISVVKDKFNVDHIIDQYEELYKSLI